MSTITDIAALPRKLQRRSQVNGEALRRFTEHSELHPERIVPIRANHPALIEGRSIFPKRVVAAHDAPRILLPGVNQRKLGNSVTKGAWKGMPIFALTLEERATCPRTCSNWATCYGNSMNWSRRHRHGPELVARLDHELRVLQRQHPQGFVVRLHILGDFYSLDYVQAWAAWLDLYPALRVFGYTAWPEDTEIGAAIAELRNDRWERFAVRTSSDERGPVHAITIDYVPDGVRTDCGSITCPAQTGRADSCGDCGLCWSAIAKHETIAFVLHGMVRSTGRRKRA